MERGMTRYVGIGAILVMGMAMTGIPQPSMSRGATASTLRTSATSATFEPVIVTAKGIPCASVTMWWSGERLHTGSALVISPVNR